MLHRAAVFLLCRLHNTVNVIADDTRPFGAEVGKQDGLMTCILIFAPQNVRNTSVYFFFESKKAQDKLLPDE